MRIQTCALLLSIAAAGGCDNKKQKTGEPVAATDSSKTVTTPKQEDLATYIAELPGSGTKLAAKIETPLGTINCELFGDKAPMTVANFVGLATGKKAWKNPNTGNIEVGKPYYDGLVFHRVIPGFMIQGGDPLGVGRGGPGYQFGSEVSQSDQMVTGALAMANAGLTTNGSQFFVMEGERPDLVGKHTVFGQCKEVEVVKAITATRGEGDRPTAPVTMKVTISKT